jgi:hypothetical protein
LRAAADILARMPGLVADAAAMVRWHRNLGWVLIATNALAGAWALGSHWFTPLRAPVLRRRLLIAAIVVAQAMTFVQAITGAVLMSRYDLRPRQLHALYGFSAIIAVGILYSYRTSTWMRGKEWLLYGLGSLFIMGLGLRELVLA